MCDGVLLQRPEGFWWEAISNSLEHPHIRISIPLAPVPLIRVSLITPPCPPPTLPKTEIALSTQDSNSQHRGTPTHPDPSSPPIKKTKSFRSLSPQATPVLSVCAYRLSAKCQLLFFCWCCAPREPLAVGWGALERYLCTPS